MHSPIAVQIRVTQDRDKTGPEEEEVPMAESSEQHSAEDIVPIQNFMRRFSHVDNHQELNRLSLEAAAKEPSRNDSNFVMALNMTTPVFTMMKVTRFLQLVTTSDCSEYGGSFWICFKVQSNHQRVSRRDLTSYYYPY